MGNQDNQAFLQIAALFGHQIVTELQALHQMEEFAKELEQNHDEDDEVLDIQIEKINDRRDVYNSLSKMRTEVEFMAAGYNGTPCCGECKTGQFTGPAKDPIAEMLEDLIKSGIGITRIDPADLFKGKEPKTGENDRAFAKPPSENKAETAAFEAKGRAAEVGRVMDNLGKGDANG